MRTNVTFLIPAIKEFHSGSLLSSHVQEWRSVWSRGRIDVKGDISIARLAYSSLYYILSSLPFQADPVSEWPFFGLSPGGLAHGEKDKVISPKFIIFFAFNSLAILRIFFLVMKTFCLSFSADILGHLSVLCFFTFAVLSFVLYCYYMHYCFPADSHHS